MTQELILDQTEEESKEVRDSKFKEGQATENVYEAKIPDKFFRRLEWFKSDLRREMKPVFELVLSKHVPELYELLTKADIPPKDARTIIVGRLVLYRSERRIVSYLPKSAKDLKQSVKADQSNAVQKEAKDNKLVEMVKEKATRQGMSESEAGKLGQIALKKKYGLGHFASAGADGGKKKGENKMEEFADNVVNEGIANTVTQQEILVKLLAPDDSTEEDEERTKQSIKIKRLWRKYEAAYIKVNLKGEITWVGNTVMDEEHISEMEEPITSSI